LLVAVLALTGQQRSLASAVRPSESAAPVCAERAQHVQSQALRVEAALRIAPAPVFARAPLLPAFLSACAWPSTQLSVAQAAPAQLRRAVSHFHSKRRIPRMNSEEPPRA
jgi:hypothetical protein